MATRARSAGPSLLVIWLAMVIAGLLAMGAVGAAVHHPSTKAASGPRVKALVDPTDKLAIDVPVDWRSPLLSAGSYGDAIRAFTARNLQFSRLTQARPPNLFAVGPGAQATLVIQSAAMAAGTDLSGLPSRLRDQYRTLGIDVLGSDSVTLPAGPAVHAVLRYIVGDRYQRASQFFIPHGERVVIVTIDGPDDGAQVALSRRMAESVHFVP